jgi:hypothetical protein
MCVRLVENGAQSRPSSDDRFPGEHGGALGGLGLQTCILGLTHICAQNFNSRKTIDISQRFCFEFTLAPTRETITERSNDKTRGFHKGEVLPIQERSVTNHCLSCSAGTHLDCRSPGPYSPLHVIAQPITPIPSCATLSTMMLFKFGCHPSPCGLRPQFENPN